MLCGDIFDNRFTLFGNYKKQKADMKRCGICGSPRDSPNIGRYVHTMYSRRCNAICSLPRHRCFGFEFVRFTSWFTFRIIVISAFVMNAHKPAVLLGHIYANRRPQTVYWCRSPPSGSENHAYLLNSDALYISCYNLSDIYSFALPREYCW